jgi:hypothetical protein
LKNFKKLKLALGINGIIALICLGIFVVALITYTTTTSQTPVKQFYQGITSDSWNIYLNEQNCVRYLPGISPENVLPPSQPVDGETSTYAFKIVTDSYRVCAVDVRLSEEANSTLFSRFDIQALFWNTTATAWEVVPIFSGPTGDENSTSIDVFLHTGATPPRARV